MQNGACKDVNTSIQCAKKTKLGISSSLPAQIIIIKYSHWLQMRAYTNTTTWNEGVIQRGH